MTPLNVFHFTYNIMLKNSTQCLIHLFSRKTIKSNYIQSCSNFYGTHKISSIGFIGLGAMGSQMSKNLLKQFNDLYVYDVNETAVAALKEEGAKSVFQLADLSTVDCIISMLPAGQQVMEVYKGPNGLISKVKPGTLLIDCSTVDLQVPQTLATEASQRGVHFLDAPVSGGVAGAAAGKLTFMVGGSVEGIQNSEPVLLSMGQHVIHCGPSGSGQAAKICNNMLLGVTMAATAEAMNLGIRLGLDPKLVASVINHSSGRSWSSDTYNPVPGVMPDVPASKGYQPGFKSSLLLKDLKLAKTVSKRCGASLPFGLHALEVYKAVCDEGNADLDFSVIYQYLQSLEDS